MHFIVVNYIQILVRQKHFCLFQWVLKIFHKDIVLITIGFTSPPSVMMCGFQMIYSMGPLMDWEVMERQKWLCRGQDVTQGNVIRLIRAVYRSWDRLSSSKSLFPVVVKDGEGGSSWLDVMETEFRALSIFLSLHSLSHYCIKHRSGRTIRTS